jgi:hypothetical protein
MGPTKNVWIAACLTAAITLSTLSGGPALAGTPSVSGKGGIESCGNWVLKLRDFGKFKVNNYGAYVPPNFQMDPALMAKPSVAFYFLDDKSFFMQFNYPDQQGQATGPTGGFLPGFNVFGRYSQNGRKLKFFPNAAGFGVLEETFANLSENTLFGNEERQLVTDVPFARITNPDNLRFKGTLKDRVGALRSSRCDLTAQAGECPTELKVKFKAKMFYDIQYENNSENADIFGAKGRLKLRMQTGKCPRSPRPPPQP